MCIVCVGIVSVTYVFFEVLGWYTLRVAWFPQEEVRPPGSTRTENEIGGYKQEEL